MKDAAAYLVHIKAQIIANPQIVHWVAVREEAQGDMGLFRYRLTLHNGDLLEMFAHFRIVEEEVQVTKYSFHWQDANGQLRKRWDNATHHPGLSTYPYHIHDGSEQNVLPHEQISAEEVLAIISSKVSD